MEEEAGIAAKKKRESTFGKVTTNYAQLGPKMQLPYLNIEFGKSALTVSIYRFLQISAAYCNSIEFYKREISLLSPKFLCCLLCLVYC